MEGYLKKWTNMIHRWKPRYFKLEKGILRYRKYRFTEVKGEIDLKQCQIVVTPKDNLRIVIKFANKKRKPVQIRANSLAEKINWIDALRTAQLNEIEECGSNTDNDELPDLRYVDSFSKEEILAKFPNFYKIDDNLLKLKKVQKTFYETLMVLAVNLKEDKENYQLLEKVDYLGGDFLKIISESVQDMKQLRKKCLKVFIDEKRKQFKGFKQQIPERVISWKTPTKSKQEEQKEEIPHKKKSKKFAKSQMVIKSKPFDMEPQEPKEFNLLDFDESPDSLQRGANQTIILSVPPDEKPSDTGEEEEMDYQYKKKKSIEEFDFKKFQEDVQRDSEQDEQQNELFMEEEIMQEDNILSLSDDVKQIVPILQKQKSAMKVFLFQTNRVFADMNLSNQKFRKSLPCKEYSQEKINFWKILQNSLVHFNEPLSMMQTICEQFQYAELLDKAAYTEDPGLRMAYVIAFAFSSYSSTCDRVKKCFNPLLGETYSLDYKDKNKEFNFFSEQVSHHPPISAFVCKNKNYTVNGNVGIRMKFWGKSLEFQSTGYLEIKLHTYNEVYTYNRGVSSIENILMGTPYIDHGGEMKFLNKTLGYKASIKLKKRGWTGYDAYKGEGKICNPKSKVVYKIKGKWNASMLAIDAQNNKEILIWKMSTKPGGDPKQFHFGEFTKQLNYLSKDLILSLPPTDSRFRPDQMALERGQLEAAVEEKSRLETNQRERRKKREKGKQVYKPLWFNKIKEEDKTIYVYKGEQKIDDNQFMNLFV